MFQSYTIKKISVCEVPRFLLRTEMFTLTINGRKHEYINNVPGGLTVTVFISLIRYIWTLLITLSFVLTS